MNPKTPGTSKAHKEKSAPPRTYHRTTKVHRPRAQTPSPPGVSTTVSGVRPSNEDAAALDTLAEIYPYEPAAVIAGLSPQRLGPYLAQVGGDPDEALLLYVYNARIAGALLEELGYAEVVLRNALVAQLEIIAARAYPGVPWYECDRMLDDWECNDILRARNAILDRAEALSGGKIIAELGFGFWTHLISSDRSWIWHNGLPRAFPCFLGAAYHQTEIHGTAVRLCELRNRIAHHEPLLEHNIAADHAQIINLVGWVSRDARNWVEASGRALALSFPKQRRKI